MFLYSRVRGFAFTLKFRQCMVYPVQKSKRASVYQVGKERTLSLKLPVKLFPYNFVTFSHQWALGVARANTAVGVSPETFLLLLLQKSFQSQNVRTMQSSLCGHQVGNVG
jgi:hypothetical protein